MVEDVHVKLNPGLPWQIIIQCEEVSLHQQIGLKFKNEISKLLHFSIAFYGAGIWTLRKIDQKYIENFEIWCWRKRDIIWTDCMESEEVFCRIKEDRNILRATNRRKANWVGHILRRNWLLKHVIERNIEETIEITGRRGRRSKQLLCGLKRNDRVLEIERGRTRPSCVEIWLWKSYGPVVRQAVKWWWYDTYLKPGQFRWYSD